MDFVIALIGAALFCAALYFVFLIIGFVLMALASIFRR